MLLTYLVAGDAYIIGSLTVGKGIINIKISPITRRYYLSALVKVLITIGSSASIGFGLWHFFVPGAWHWYLYIDPNAKELVNAVRAINLFFSLSLVLFGLLSLLFILGDNANRYSIIVLFTATCTLWLTRVAFQVFYPQGSLVPGLKYGMLLAFTLVCLCYLISLVLIVFVKNIIKV